jgi:hypothetical protein
MSRSRGKWLTPICGREIAHPGLCRRWVWRWFWRGRVFRPCLWCRLYYFPWRDR